MGRHGRPRVGDVAPEFNLQDADGTPVRLSDFTGVKTVVLYFYPKDATAGCTVESCAFRDAYPDLSLAGAEVLGISRDDIESHTRFSSSHRLPFPLLSDPDGEVHDRYGVRSRLGGLIRDRITFVVDRSGVVRLVFPSSLRFAAHVKAALNAVRALAWVREPR
jgi:peroxiredoxin Q/BCP